MDDSRATAYLVTLHRSIAHGPTMEPRQRGRPIAQKIARSSRQTTGSSGCYF